MRPRASTRTPRRRGAIVLGITALGAALLLGGAAPARAQGGTELRVASIGPLRLPPLTRDAYADGHSRPIAVDYTIVRCEAGMDAVVPRECAVQLLGVLPFEGLTVEHVQWATQPAGPWAELRTEPVVVASVPTGTAFHAGRLYLRTRVSWAEVPARGVDYRALVRLRLSR